MTRFAGRSITLLALAALLLAVTASSGSAASPRRGRILGVVTQILGAITIKKIVDIKV